MVARVLTVSCDIIGFTKGVGNMDFEQLKKEGKTIIYKETETNEQPDGWEFWGERKTETEHVYVWRKIVTLEEAEQYYAEQELLY